MKHHKLKSFVYLIFSSILLFSTTTSVIASPIKTESENQTESSHDWPKAPSVTADSAIVMDATTGLILYEKNSTKKKYPASITKIMTTLLALENSSLNETVTFSRDAIFGVDLDSSRIGIDVGEQLSMEDALYAVMLASANEVSYGVAEHVGGSLENFVTMMNERAKELGCVNTHFNNPHGLQDENHYTCAYDMALIAKEAIKNTTFAQITGSRTYVIRPTNIQKEARPLANHHKFIKKDIHYNGAIGGKTGYTATAKYTLVTYAKRGDMSLICVVMGSDSTATEYSDTSSLLDYGFDNYSIYSIASDQNEYLAQDSPLFKKYSTIFDPKQAFLTTGDNGYVVLPNYASLSDVTRKVQYYSSIETSHDPTVIGSVEYTYDGRTVGKTDILYRQGSNRTLPTRINSLLDPTSSTVVVYKETSKKNYSLIASVIFGVALLVITCLIWLLKKRKRQKEDYLRYRRSYYKQNY